MISGALVGAVAEIDHYLNDAYFRRHYEQAGVLTRIRLVRHAMDDLRQELDTLEAAERLGRALGEERA